MNTQRHRNRKASKGIRRDWASKRRRFSRSLQAERLEDRRLLTGVAGHLAYHNTIIPADVTGDYYVSPRDALAVITELNTNGARVLVGDGASDVPATGRVDTTGDNMLSPLDALRVITALNDGEAEEGDVMAINVQALDVNGNPLPGNRVKAGDDFQILVTVQDLRTVPTAGVQGTGVYSAYLDIAYSNNLSSDVDAPPLFTLGGTDPSEFEVRADFEDFWTRVELPISQGGGYLNGSQYANPWRWGTPGAYSDRDGDMVPNEFDEMGGFLLFVPSGLDLGNDVYPMMRGLLTAELPYDEPGTITFQGNAPDGQTSDLLFINSVEDIGIGGDFSRARVDPNFVDFGSVAVTVYKPVYAMDADATTNEDTAKLIPFVGKLDSATTGPITLDSFTQPANGTVTLETPITLVGNEYRGTFRYTPKAHYNIDMGGPDIFSYILRDAQGNTDGGLISVTVLAVNDNPIANPDAFTRNEDEGPYDLNVVENDKPGPAGATDEVGQTLSLVSAGHAGVNGVTQRGGTVEVISATHVRYNPAANFFGVDTFSYVVEDSEGGTASATVTVTVENTNDPPTANDDTFGVAPLPLILEDLNGAAFVQLNVGANDTIAPDTGETLTVVGVGQSLSGDTINNPGETAQGGMVEIQGGTIVRYTPAADFNGTDTFVYRLSDGKGGFDTATVTVIVTPVNDPPIPGDEPLFAKERLSETDPPSELDVLVGAKAGPADETEAVLINAIVAQPQFGTLEISADKLLLIYTPNVGVVDVVDTFRYTIIDEFGAVSEPVTAEVTVEPLFRPYARDDRATTPEDNSITIDVQGNDLPNEGEGITRTFALVESIDGETINTTDTLTTAHGTATIVDGKVFYTPNADYFGTDTFQYVIDDDVEGSLPSVGTVRVTVTSVNDAPIAGDDDLTAPANQIAEDTPTKIFALANDVAGPANETEEIFLHNVVTAPAHGTVSIVDGGKAFLYTPKANYYGPDNFQYTMRDAFGAVSNVATVNLIVHNVNDPPTALDKIFWVDEDSTNNSLPAMLGDFVGAPNVPDGADSIRLVSVGVPSAGGTVTIVGDGTAGTVLYTPAPDFFGEETFTYTIRDSVDPTYDVTAVVTVMVRDVNDPPTVLNEDGSGENQERLMALKNFTDQELVVLANDSIAPDINEILLIKELIGQDESGVEVRGVTDVPTKYGMVSISADGTKVIYTPNTDFETVGDDYDSFGYVVMDVRDGEPRGGETEGFAEIDVIDAVPSDVSGVVYMDSNGDGVQQSGELTLAGIDVTLTGTNIRGAAVNVTVQTDANGVFVFPGILPTAAEDLVGYRISATTPAYLNDGIDTIVDAMVDEDYNPGEAHNDVFTGIQLGVWGSNGRANGNYAFGEGGLQAKYIRLTQLLASTHNGLMMACDGQGDTYWFSIMDGWEGVKSVQFSFDSIADTTGMTKATLTVTDMAGQVHTKRLSYYKDYDFAGDPREGGSVIFLKGTAADMGFDLSAAGDTLDAEGEMAEEMLVADAQYEDGVDAVFAGGDWA